MLDALAASLLANAHRPDPVEIRIPADHPRADDLVGLFQQLSSGVTTPGGIVLAGGGISGEAVSIFLGALRDVLVEEGVDFGALMAPLLEPGGPKASIGAIMERTTQALMAGKAGG